MFKIVLCILLIFLTNSCKSTIAPEESIKYSSTNLVLGISFPPSANQEQLEFSVKQMDLLHLNWYRINQNWADREPSQGTFNWLPLENRLAYFGSAGKKVLLTLDMKNLPTWWSTLSDDSIRIERFSNFCTELLSRCSGKISMIQFGNEWNWEIDAYLPGANKDQLYIGMANALYDAVKKVPELNRPSVVFGSVSIGGLRFISYVAGSIQNIQLTKGLLFSDANISDFNANRETGILRMKNIISNVKYDIIDLHLYDDSQNWGMYLADYKNLITACNKNPDEFQYIASEFGGPHPTLEPTDETFAKDQLVQYINTLDTIGISTAFYFKLVESSSEGLEHPNSFLIDINLNPNSRFDMIKNYGETNK